MSTEDLEIGEKTTNGNWYKFDGPKADAKKTDRKIKYCCDCERCWIINEFSSPKHEPEYYVDFPAYGKQVVSCPNCKI